jgi:hypothetical protein
VVEKHDHGLNEVTAMALRTKTIYACSRYNRTGWKVEPGKRYALKAVGSWWDFFIPCGPAGYSLFWLRWLEKYRRAPEAKWFALIGFIDSGSRFDEEQRFTIGKDLASWTPEQAGELVCYANDLRYMYWNNWGSITLEMHEL